MCEFCGTFNKPFRVLDVKNNREHSYMIKQCNSCGVIYRILTYCIRLMPISRRSIDSRFIETEFCIDEFN